MIQSTIKLSGGLEGFSDPRVSVNSDAFLTIGQERMQELGEFAIKTIRGRVSKGIGSDDSPMPPLKVSPHAGARFKIHGQSRQILTYAQWKSKHGLQPIRDLKGTGKDGGNMLDNISVRTVSGSSVTIALTARKARQKALANEKRAPWFSFSDADSKAIAAEFARSAGAAVEVLTGAIRRVWRNAA